MHNIILILTVHKKLENVIFMFSIFETLYYSKDKNHVFVYGKLLKDADVATFEPVNKKHSLLYKDKNHTYRGDEIIKNN